MTIHNREMGKIVFDPKHASACQLVNRGIGMPSNNVNALASYAWFVSPLDGEPMRGILACDSEHVGNSGRPFMLQADEANADNGESAL